MGAFFTRPAARRDLVAHYGYPAEYAGEAVADRFLTNAEVELASGRHRGEHLRQPQSAPQLPEHVQVAVAPRIGDLPIRIGGDDRLRRAAAQDAARRTGQPLGAGRVVAAAAVGDDLDAGPALRRVPRVRGQLEVSEYRAVGARLPGFAQVRVRNDGANAMANRARSARSMCPGVGTKNSAHQRATHGIHAPWTALTPPHLRSCCRTRTRRSHVIVTGRAGHGDADEMPAQPNARRRVRNARCRLRQRAPPRMGRSEGDLQSG